MRIIRLKIDKNVTKALAQVSKEFGFADNGFVEDIFALLRFKGHGVPSKDRCKALARKWADHNPEFSEIIYGMLIHKRASLLTNMSKLPYFAALAVFPDPVDSTIRLLTTFRKLYYKVRESQCASCSLLKSCDFGQKYGNKVSAIGSVADEDWKKLVNPGCQSLPQIESLNQIFEAVDQMYQRLSTTSREAQVADNTDPNQHAYYGKTPPTQFGAVGSEASKFVDTDQDQDGATDDETLSDNPNEASEGYVVPPGSVGKTGRYDGMHTSNRLVKLTESFVDQVSKEKLIVWELGRSLDVALEAAAKGKFKPVVHVAKDRDQDRVDGVKDVAKIRPHQHALPSSAKVKKLVSRELDKVNNTEPEEHKQLLYVLSDNSGSMGGLIGSSGFGLLTRGALCSVFSLALARKVMRDGGIYHHRFFAGAVGRLTSATSKAEAEALYDYIATASYNGGGTDIVGAVTMAVADIKKAGASQKIAKAEILAITDCEDHFDEAAVRKALNGTPLNVIDCSGSRQSGSASHLLRRVATKYMKANEKALTVADLVKVVV